MTDQIKQDGGDSTTRRQFLATVTGGVAVGSVPGCLGILPSGTTDSTYPGGTVVIENAGERTLAVSITVVEDGYDSSLEATVASGETHVSRGFVDADTGEVVTLAARLGDSGEATTFEFLPGGGENATRPEVTRLTIQNAVEASAAWTAERAEQ